MFHLKKSTAICTFLIFSAAFLGTRISFGQDHVFPDYSRWSDQAVVNYLGHKHPHYLGVIAKHAGYLELDYEQRVSIELAIQEIGKLRGGAYYSAAFPEIDGFAPDFLDRIASLNLDPVEFASRKAFAHNMLQKTGGEYVKLEKRRAASILLPHQKKLANNSIVFNAM